MYYEKHSGIKNLPLPITEIVLHVCLWTLIIEELRQVKREKIKYFKKIEASLFFSLV